MFIESLLKSEEESLLHWCHHSKYRMNHLISSAVVWKYLNVKMLNVKSVVICTVTQIVPMLNSKGQMSN